MAGAAAAASAATAPGAGSAARRERWDSLGSRRREAGQQANRVGMALGAGRHLVAVLVGEASIEHAVA